MSGSDGRTFSSRRGFPAIVGHRATEGLATLHLRVLESRTELQDWYARHDFVETGEVVPFAGDAANLKVPGLGMAVMVRALA
ncbi:hypothetical protein [Brachybacterium subflavum]|uniref:hypothetical protein n=1 Tax=Brachybacterium subflavum TaxID=2585206 RepID=UPI0012663527|nr:hypothetical protein [Brachybacterium subflavum]